MAVKITLSKIFGVQATYQTDSSFTLNKREIKSEMENEKGSCPFCGAYNSIEFVEQCNDSVVYQCSVCGEIIFGKLVATGYRVVFPL